VRDSLSGVRWRVRGREYRRRIDGGVLGRKGTGPRRVKDLGVRRGEKLAIESEMEGRKNEDEFGFESRSDRLGMGLDEEI